MITPACAFFARVARRCRLEILHEEIPFRTPTNPDQRPQARAHEAAVAAVQEVLPLSWQEASGEAINAVQPLPSTGACSPTRAYPDLTLLRPARNEARRHLAVCGLR